MFIKRATACGALICAALFFFIFAGAAHSAVPYTGGIAPFVQSPPAATVQLQCARAGIASHHGLASKYIENFYATMAASCGDVSSVILLGPDHYGKVRGAAALCPEDWKYGNITVTTDTAALKALKGAGYLDVRAEPFIMEHSVGLHIPFIKRYFPNAAVTAIIISPRASLFRLDELARLLSGLFGKETIMILSMDFSHGKTQNEARKEDDKSVKALTCFDLKSLPSLDIDAPRAAGLFLRTLELTGNTKPFLLGRTDSAAIVGDPSLPCTSYAFIIYGK